MAPAAKPKGVGVRSLRYEGEIAGFGHAMGEELREDIHGLSAVLADNFAARTGLDPHAPEIIATYRSSWERAYGASETIEMVMAGIAEGGGIPLEEVEFINSFLELVSYRESTLRVWPGGCTTLGVADGNTVVVAQNYDMERFYSAFTVGIDATFPEFRLGLFSFAGVLGCVGQTTRGWCLGINFLHASDIVPTGFPHTSLVFEALTARDLGTALGTLTFGDRACGGHLLVGTREGLLFSLEISGRRHAVRYLTNGFVAHANDFLDPGLRDVDLLLWSTTTDSARGASRQLTRSTSASRATPWQFGQGSLGAL